MGETRFIPTLSLQKANNQTLSGDSQQHKSMLQGGCNILVLWNFLKAEMVGVTGIEPVTPTMST